MKIAWVLEHAARRKAKVFGRRMRAHAAAALQLRLCTLFVFLGRFRTFMRVLRRPLAFAVFSAWANSCYSGRCCYSVCWDFGGRVPATKVCKFSVAAVA